MLARMSLGPHTATESLQRLEPIGVDRWGFELALKHGVRDMFSCPVGGRWLVTFWSAAPLGKEFTDGARIMIFAAASFAALRLDQLAPLSPAHLKKLQLKLGVRNRTHAVAEALRRHLIP
jgi:LuxR family quorum sensing-dependent transcriptional regulator